MQMYTGTRLTTATHRRVCTRFFFRGGDVCTQAICTSRQDHDPGDHELSLCIHLIDLFTDTAAILN